MSNIKEELVEKITSHFNLSVKTGVIKLQNPNKHIYPASPELKRLKSGKKAIQYTILDSQEEIKGVDYFFISETFFNKLVGPNGLFS